MKLIGIAGTNGSGKDSVGEILQQNYGYLFISVSDLLRNEAKRRGETVEREVLRTISTQWRREFGLGALVDKSIQMYQEKGGDSRFKGLVMASLRNPGEADRIHELGGKMVWTDADPKVRYERINARKRDDDNKTFEQFLAEEDVEMKHSGDEATLSVSGVKAKCDITLLNNGATIEELEQLILKELKEHL